MGKGACLREDDRRRGPRSPEVRATISRAGRDSWTRAREFAKHFGCPLNKAHGIMHTWLNEHENLIPLVIEGNPWAIKRARTVYKRERTRVRREIAKGDRRRKREEALAEAERDLGRALRRLLKALETS